MKPTIADALAANRAHRAMLNCAFGFSKYNVVLYAVHTYCAEHSSMYPAVLCACAAHACARLNRTNANGQIERQRHNIKLILWF